MVRSDRKRSVSQPTTDRPYENTGLTCRILSGKVASMANQIRIGRERESTVSPLQDRKCYRGLGGLARFDINYGRGGRDTSFRLRIDSESILAGSRVDGGPDVGTGDGIPDSACLPFQNDIEAETVGLFRIC